MRLFVSMYALPGHPKFLGWFYFRRRSKEHMIVDFLVSLNLEWKDWFFNARPSSPFNILITWSLVNMSKVNKLLVLNDDKEKVLRLLMVPCRVVLMSDLSNDQYLLRFGQSPVPMDKNYMINIIDEAIEEEEVREKGNEGGRVDLPVIE
ncbi:uncharacterized protein LOC122060229 [Macadamia integrifolia]|uniref:uncharacterized protein LOC122060229 n=1 Tax=Macadamia integrifolia TaxID=60698 RepID=UPI001C530F23|nr:uncharacterized protein LOC122060229 [Macadamia integrifolia]